MVKEGQKRGRKGYTVEGIGNAREGNSIQGGEKERKGMGIQGKKGEKEKYERGEGKNGYNWGEVLIKESVPRGMKKRKRKRKRRRMERKIGFRGNGKWTENY